jgi:predicted amidohydrolase
MAVVAGSEDTERLGAAARAANVYLVMGCNELDERPEVNTIYNSLLFFAPDGRMIGRHRKTMPTFGERQFWGMGSVEDLRVFDTDIGRLGGLVCGEHVMTLIRAAMIAQGEEIHVAVFPGSFSLHVGPRLEEPDKDGFFWGHAQTRAHAFEAGAFVLSACVYLDPADVPDDFAYKGRMNIDYAHGGSQIVAPIGVPLVPPTFGPGILYADCPAAMIKAIKAIVDTMGHYSRPDIVELVVKRRDGGGAAQRLLFRGDSHPSDGLERAAERHGVDPALAARAARQAIAPPGPGE